MLGQVAALRDARSSIAQLHREITDDAAAPARDGGRTVSADRGAAGARPTRRSWAWPVSCPARPTLPRSGATSSTASTRSPRSRSGGRLAALVRPRRRRPGQDHLALGRLPRRGRLRPAPLRDAAASLDSIEPMQLLTLEVAAAALADAGYDRREFARERTSVVLGVGGGLSDLGTRYAVRADLPLVLNDVPADALAGPARMDRGLVRRASCSTSRPAGSPTGSTSAERTTRSTRRAPRRWPPCSSPSRELECGTSDMVVVGGADTVQNPFGYLCFSKTQALSPSGRCQPFDRGRGRHRHQRRPGDASSSSA